MKQIYRQFLNHLNSKILLIQMILLAQKKIKFVSDSLSDIFYLNTIITLFV